MKMRMSGLSRERKGLKMKHEYSRTHKVKIDKPYFENVLSGRKRFEIRKDDRDYQVGDWLTLVCENQELTVKIIYKTTFQQKEGYCVLGIDWPA